MRELAFCGHKTWRKMHSLHLSMAKIVDYVPRTRNRGFYHEWQECPGPMVPIAPMVHTIYWSDERGIWSLVSDSGHGIVYSEHARISRPKARMYHLEYYANREVTRWSVQSTCKLANMYSRVALFIPVLCIIFFIIPGPKIPYSHFSASSGSGTLARAWWKKYYFDIYISRILLRL